MTDESYHYSLVWWCLSQDIPIEIGVGNMDHGLQFKILKLYGVQVVLSI